MSIRGADQISDELKFKGTLLKSLRLSDEKAEVMKLYVQNDQYIFYRWDDINIKASPDTAFQYICQNVLSFLPSSKPSAVGYYNVAKILMGRRQLAGDQSQNDSILKYLQIAQTLAPNWTSPYRYLKYELLASGDTARAELFAEKEFELSSSKNKYINISKFYFYSSSNEWQKGISWLKKGIENASQPDVKREHYMALCRAYMNTSKCDSAMYLLQEMEQTIQVKPQKGSIYNVFNCQLEYNQNDLKALRKWIISQNWELNTMPYFASYLLFFGNHLKDSKDTENGKQIFTSLDDSCKVECLKLLSQHYILIHDFNNAEKNLLLAKEMKPNNRTIAYDIFKLYEKINDTLKVISSLKKLIAIDSLNGRHFIELAKYEILMGNNASAQLLIEKAEQLSSRGDYLIRIAKTYRHLGNEEKFNEISRKALQSGYEEKKDKYYTLIFDDDSYLVSYTKPCR
jgi:hypothetical protein